MKAEERSGLPEPARKRLVALLLVGAASTVAGLGLAVDTLIAVGLLLGLAGGLPSCRLESGRPPASRWATAQSPSDNGSVRYSTNSRCHQAPASDF